MNPVPRIHGPIFALAVVLLAVALVPAAEAQSIWTPRFEQSAIQVEAVRPVFEGGADLSLASSLWFLTGRVRASSQLHVVGDFSFSNLDPEDGGSSSTIGNPYIGVEFMPAGRNLTVELGTRLPLAEDGEFGAKVFGIYGDISRWEAWAEDMLPVILVFHHRSRDERGFGLRLDAGPIFWIPTGDREDGEVLLVYAFQGTFEGDDVRFNGGLNGRAILSEDEFDLGGSTLHEFGVSFSVRLGQSWPGFLFRVPLDEDLSDIMAYTVGLQVSFELPERGAGGS